ncbi:hypothetical protein [Paracoccus sediminilitoris]|uniref:hypothetical protein n=1 Tax=Paracoccus sediminilitoris TaxID=2202419 RepID=UPI000DB9AF55|nr:hypothetical protein [Paracoccus sediminilitoris]
MAQLTGIIEAKHAGATYRLTLGMSGLARLQEEYGKGLEPLIAMAQEGQAPDFAVLLRVTQVALERFHPDADPYLADDLLAADVGIAVAVMSAAFAGLQAATPGKAGGATASGKATAPRGKAKPGKRG